MTDERRFDRALVEAKLRPSQKEAVVEYVTSWERRGIEKWRLEARQETLEVLRAVLLDVVATRFGAPGKSMVSRIGRIDSVDELRILTHRALTASSLVEAGL